MPKIDLIHTSRPDAVNPKRPASSAHSPVLGQPWIRNFSTLILCNFEKLVHSPAKHVFFFRAGIYNLGSPSSNFLYKPLNTIVMSTINHSEIGVIWPPT